MEKLVVENSSEELKIDDMASPDYGNYALKVSGLCRKQGKFELNDISFALPRGYIMGLVGRMGLGKTTLLKSILNPELIKSGSVEYEGQAGFIMEDAPFFIEATLKENMEVFKNLYKDYDEKEFYDRLKSVGLGDHKVYGLLSKGEKVRFQFAFAMGHHPSLLLLDEPTSGLDVTFRREFLYMLQEAVEKQMISVVFSTHLTDELERVADFIGVMEDGTLTISENEIQNTLISDAHTSNIGSINTETSNAKNSNTDIPDTDISNTPTRDVKRQGEKAKGNASALRQSDMPDLKGMISFCRGVYLKNQMRVVPYIICFFQFIFGWIVFLSEDERRFAFGFMTGIVFVGIVFQYLGTATQEGEGTGRRMEPMRVEHFFGVNPWLMWRARMLCLMRSSLCFLVVGLVHFAAVTAITGNAGCLPAVVGIAADYVAVAVLSAVVTLIIS